MSAVEDPPEQTVVEHDSLDEALFAFRAEAPQLPKDKTNPHFGSKFTSLETIARLVDPLLHKHGLLWTTKPVIRHGKPALAYKLVHVPSKEKDEGVAPLLLDKENSQGVGSATSYMRRYAKTSILDLVADDDDDGNAASPARTGYGRSPRAGTGVNLTGAARGLSDQAINAARQEAGLDPVEEAGNLPWKSLLSIQPELATALEDALRKAQAGE